MATDNVWLDPIRGKKTCDFLNSLRKLSNERIALIAQILSEEGALNFGELRTRTDFSKNVLNHSLIAMKNADLVVQDEDRRYCLTKYAVVLIKSFAELNSRLQDMGEENLFMPSTVNEAESEAL